MVCYFTGVYMTNKTLHDRLQIRNFYEGVNGVNRLATKGEKYY